MHLVRRLGLEGDGRQTDIVTCKQAAMLRRSSLGVLAGSWLLSNFLTVLSPLPSNSGKFTVCNGKLAEDSFKRDKYPKTHHYYHQNSVDISWQFHINYLFVSSKYIVDFELTAVKVWTLVRCLMPFSLNS